MIILGELGIQYGLIRICEYWKNSRLTEVCDIVINSRKGF